MQLEDKKRGIFGNNQVKSKMMRHKQRSSASSIYWTDRSNGRLVQRLVSKGTLGLVFGREKFLSLGLLLVVISLNLQIAGASSAFWWPSDTHDDCDCDLLREKLNFESQPFSLAAASARDKREAVDLARNRLHILEQLDSQLRVFADIDPPAPTRLSPANPSIISESGQQICLLPLDFSVAASRVGDDREAIGCLADPKLKRLMPHYMLNLRRQLLDQARTLAEAVRLMPYKSLVMRSFTQPQPRVVLESNGGSEQKDYGEPQYLPGLVVELNALESEEQDLMKLVESQAGRELELEMQELRDPVETKKQDQPEHQLPPGRRASSRQRKVNNNACCSTPSGDDDEGAGESDNSLCYWFEISEQLQMKINGSLVESRESSSMKRERLVEAELHLFKLLPDTMLRAPFSSSATATGLIVDTRSKTHIGSEPALDRRTGSVSAPVARRQHQDARLGLQRELSYHLKTNLLEVSLYQILPNSELRLLDIRRMDLHSSGWETFYVKRALEDWISNSSLNLGLVIKAKSMLDEQIRVGLVRFADLRAVAPASGSVAVAVSASASVSAVDKTQAQSSQSLSKGSDYQRKTTSRRSRRNRPPGALDAEAMTRQSENQVQQQALKFNLGHQPILVIYTTSVD